MKRIITVIALSAFVVASLAAPATAKKKKPKPPAPVATTLYAHGTNQFGEQDQTVDGTFLKFDAVEPTGSSSKSMGFFMIAAGGVGTPNVQCGGNSLMPVFVGPLSGTVKGDMKFIFTVASLPGTVEIRVWPDLAAQACNDAFIEPTRAVEVALPGGEAEVEAVIPGVDFSAQGVVMVQITPTQDMPKLGRVLYDSTGDMTRLEFMCVPAAGTSCTG